MSKKRIWWYLGISLLAIAIFVFHKPILAFISLEQAKTQSISFKTYADANYGISVAIYILSYIVTIALGIPGVAPLSLLGGFLFGVIPGIIYSLVGITGGSCLSFFAMRNFLRTFVRKRYAQQLERFDVQMKRYGSSYLLMIHYSSLVPSVVINAMAALANVSSGTFIWTTILGALPLSVIYVIAGKQLSKINSIGEIFSPTIIGLLMILLLFALVPFIIRKLRESRSVE